MIVIYKVIDAETKEELFVGMDELAEATYVYPKCKHKWFKERERYERQFDNMEHVTYKINAYAPTDREYAIVVDMVEGWGGSYDCYERLKWSCEFLQTPETPPAGYECKPHDCKYSLVEYNSLLQDFCCSLPSGANQSRKMHHL